MKMVLRPRKSEKSEDQEKLKHHLKQKITEEILPVHETEREQLRDSIHECVEYGSTHSILLLGMPGQGTTFVSLWVGGLLLLFLGTYFASS